MIDEIDYTKVTPFPSIGKDPMVIPCQPSEIEHILEAPIRDLIKSVETLTGKIEKLVSVSHDILVESRISRLGKEVTNG